MDKAGVAKGTFYLYFKDKYDIKNRLIAHKTSQLFARAYEELLRNPDIKEFEDKLIFICDNVLDSLTVNKPLLGLISKDLSWGVFNRVLSTPEDGMDFREIYNNMILESGHKLRSPEIMLFMIVELVGSTGYSAIMYDSPVTISELKPNLYETIRSIIHNFQE